MIIKKFTSSRGSEVVIRKVKEEDAAEIIDFVRLTLASFTEFVLTTVEEFQPTIEEEKAWIREHNAPGCFLAVAEIKKKIVGIIHLKPEMKKKASHLGELAIALHPDFTDQKIGTQLMVCLIEWARNEKGLEKVILNVSEQNPRAIHIYKKLGFIQEGLNMKAVKQKDGTYTNNIEMALFV